MASRLISLLPVLLLCAGCGFNPSVPSAPTAAALQDTHMSYQPAEDVSSLPADLQQVEPLWEVVLSKTANRPTSRTRLYADGRQFTWSNSRRRLVDGKPHRVAAPYAWRLDAQISADGVAQVQQLIRREFVAVASGEVGQPGADQGTTTWRSFVDGSAHVVTLPSSATNQQPQAIRAIEYAILSSIIAGAVPIEQ
jgi:hypothetical protein